MLHKFFVVVDQPEYKEQIQQELLSHQGDETIPVRIVNCVDPMPGSEYNGIFLLTQEEADALTSDLRVRDVHRIPEELGIMPKTTGSRSGVFDNSPSSVTSSQKNYGLRRSAQLTNEFTTGYTVSGNFTYNLDGTGVDVILMDSGIEPGHPEFAVNADGTGGSRVIDYDWSQHGYLSTPAGGFMGDQDGHGSNCASIAAGNTNGWATGAHIYSIRIFAGNSIYDSRALGALSALAGYQSIRAFHNAKTVDPVTGYKRPTVVNNSWGYFDTYWSPMTSVTHRGTTHSVTTTTGVSATMYGTIGKPQNGDGGFGSRSSAIDAEIQSCINAGIIMVGSAGNNAHKIDISSGDDYNNYVIMPDYPGVPRYYHRGGSPTAADGVICVGALDNMYTSYDAKAFFSCAGPRVNIWAPGVAIMGAYANATYYQPAVTDPRNSSYYLNKISGTSQAGPQVTGVVACLLQARPWMTATNVLNWLKSVSLKGLMNENALVGNGYGFGTVGTYTNMASLMSGTNYILYQAFNSADTMRMS